VSDLVWRYGVQNVRAAFARVTGESVLLVLPTRAVSRIAFLEYGGEIRSSLGELFVRYCAWVVDDLSTYQ